ncbi:RNA polymerase subunit sigma-70 [Streptomyces sp. NPDC002055]|uniref:RNA polymerase subunit sigma-70 n=1 Tax=Streptomyces sp. NPDC002055 TaxID=3154534 RepID=UPI00332F7B32
MPHHEPTPGHRESAPGHHEPGRHESGRHESGHHEPGRPESGHREPGPGSRPGDAPSGTAPPHAAPGGATPGGDRAAFALLAERHHRELHIHCYRMLGSFEEAEDLVQETLLRARRQATSAEGDPASREPEFRTLLYRIATAVCHDALRHKRRPPALHSIAEVPWVQPYPDRLLDQAAPRGGGPGPAAVTRETIELSFLAALQLLPPRQRAALVLRDVLGRPAEETAALLGTTATAAGSALQRARATLREHRPPHRDDPGSAAGREDAAEGKAEAEVDTEAELLRRYVDAHERADTAALTALLREDVRVTTLPRPWSYEGRAALAPLFEQTFGPQEPGDWKLLPTGANRSPAAAGYLRAEGASGHRAFKLDVLRVEGGAIAEITTFDAELFPAFGLGLTL